MASAAKHGVVTPLTHGRNNAQHMEHPRMSTNEQGFFTLPGESGYEKLTLELAKKWGADVIRDSDGTKLSQEILDAGYGIYSTICIIRDHNEWAANHRDMLQETFLMTSPKVAMGGSPLEIRLMDEFFDGRVFRRTVRGR